MASKKRVQVDDLYAHFGLQPHLLFEQKTRHRLGKPREIGTTTRMLLEALTDAMNGCRVLVVVRNLMELPRTRHREWSPVVKEALKTGVEIKGWHEWSQAPGAPDGTLLYFDHYKVGTEFDRRLTGPWGLIREIRVDEKKRIAHAYDHSDNRIMSLTLMGARHISTLSPPYRIKDSLQLQDNVKRSFEFIGSI